MIVQLRPVTLILLLCRTCICQMGKPTMTGDGKSSGTISMGPPDLSDEETQANYMPAKLRCEACEGIAKRFSTTLQTEMDKYKAVREGKKDLSEDSVLELFETICSDTEWNGYGIKEVDSVKHLIFPGSDASNVPGIMQGGGPWPRRLSDMCYVYIGDHDEYKIYRTQKKHKNDGILKLLCSTECNSTRPPSKNKKRPKNEL